MAFRWLETFRIRRASRRFAAQVAAGDAASALVTFDARLAPYEARVDPALRATAHLLRWTAAPNERDLGALRKLAASSAEIGRTFRAVQRLDFALRLTAALHAGDSKSIAPLRAVRDEGNDPDAALQRLALAILETRLEPRTVLLALPQAPPPSFERACAQLRIGARMQLAQYDAVAADDAGLGALDPAAARGVRLAAAIGWMQQGIRANDLSSARRAAAVVASVTGIPPRLADAVTELGFGRLTAGREMLEAFRESDFGVHAGYLAALSLLAATKEWPESSETEVRVNNRALWRALRAELDSLVESLSKGGDWRGPLLAGLIARVDSGIAFDLDAIARFAAAAEHVVSTGARTRLRDVQAALMLRARATDEAVTLIHEGRYDALRDLNLTVIATSPESVPPLVRAAICLALFDHDPSYDPLPELMRIAPSAEEQPLLQQCVSEVRIAQTLRALAARCLDRGTGVPPLDAVMSVGGELAAHAAVAAAVAHARAGDVDEAWRLVGGNENPSLGDLRLHLAWRRRDAAACLALAPEQPAVNVLALLSVADGTLDRPLRELLARIGGDPAKVVMSAAVWLIDRGKAAAAQSLLQKLREQFDDHRLFLELEPFVNARLGRFSAVIDAFDRLPPFRPSIEPGLYAWCRLLRIEAELALAARAADAEAKTRWRSIHRALEACRGDLGDGEPLRTYTTLLHGLFAFIATDTWVESATIDGLADAQLLLPLEQRTAFLDDVLGKLRWRQRVVAAFWEALRGGQLKQARLIFHDELLPVFGDRMPPPIQLGMVLADWGTGAAPTAELLRRLDLLVEEAPELKGEVADQTRRYITDGEQLRRVTKLLEEQQYEQLFDDVNRFCWSGLPSGSMPVPVAIAQLFACFKLRKDEIVEDFAAQIAEDETLAAWARDDGALLLGYIRFTKEDYAGAAAAFEKTSTSTLLGHDIDRYTAAAWFRDGTRLLAIEQRDKAFDAFRRALQRSGAAPSAALAPLFLHFGLRAIDANDGGRARQAFELIAESLASEQQTPEVAADRIRAGIGVILCRVLTGEEVAAAEVSKLWRETENVELQRVLHILIICIELRFRRTKSIREQLQLLEDLEPQLRRRDPLVRVLATMLDVVVDRKRVTADRLAELEKAIRLGVRSFKLQQLLQRERDLMKAAIERSSKTFDLFDGWLASGVVPPSVAGLLVRDDELAELYRLHRGYEPADIVAPFEPSGVEPICERLLRFAEFVEAAHLGRDTYEGAAKLRKLAEKLKETETEIRHLEPQVMLQVADWLKKPAEEQGGTHDERAVARGASEKRPRAGRPQ